MRMSVRSPLSPLTVIGRLSTTPSILLHPPPFLSLYSSTGCCCTSTADNWCDPKIISRAFEMRKGVAQVRRLKLVFIGPGGVGKSSLTMRLQGQTTFVANLPATDGVAVGTMELTSSGPVRTEVKIHRCCGR